MNFNMAKSLKVNFAFNIINTLHGLLFPLLTFPYVARVVMAEGIGQVNFYNSIINYVVLFSSIGIPMYGIREIARVRDNVKDLTITTAEILTLNVLLNLLGYVAIAILCLTVAEVQVNIPLFLLLSTSIIMTTIGSSWFYSGMEEFKLITIQGLITSVVSIIFLYTFVKDENDLMLYAVYTILGSTGKYIFNFFYLKHYIKIDYIKLKDIHPFRHLKPSLQIFVFNLMTSIYINLDSVMLGFIKDVAAVGYYSAATKVSHIFVVTISSIGNVLLPRTSNLIKNGKIDEFNYLTEKAFRFITMISFPICLGVIVMAPVLIHLFGGETFTPSIFTLQLVAPTIVAISLSQVTGIQVLYPLGKINLVTISTCVGVVLNVILNVLLMPRFAQDGAAIASSIAEFGVTLTQFIMVRKYITFNLINKNFFRYVIFSLIMFIFCASAISFITSDVLALIIIPIVGALTFAALLLIFRDSFFMEVVDQIKSRFVK